VFVIVHSAPGHAPHHASEMQRDKDRPAAATLSPRTPARRCGARRHEDRWSMQAILESLGPRLARLAVQGLALMAAVLVLVGLYAHVLHTAVARGPLLRTPSHGALAPASCEAPPGMSCIRLGQTALR
jgi:hypothetical protein